MNSQLADLAGLVWPTSGAVVVTAGPVPPGYRAAERYAVVPGRSGPTFLVPLAPRAAAGSLTRYGALRPTSVRLARTVLGAGFRIGLAQSLLRDRLTVCIAEGADPAEHLVVSHLSQVLGRPLHAAIGVRAPDPNYKPTLQLFASDGSPVAYAKLGWNRATRRMGVREAQALQAMREVSRVRVPRLLHEGEWRGLRLTVTAPLPPAVRAHRDHGTPPPVAFDRDLRSVSALSATPYWAGVRREIAGMDDEPAFAAVLADLAGRLENADPVLEFGRWHGDWVPWNIAWNGPELHVWDWEHSALGVPYGFDRLHWHFQVALVLHRRPLREACQAVFRAAPEPALAWLYLLEMALRTYRLKREGTGWNPAIHPGLAEVLSEGGVGVGA
ncbi:hypothetical protein [Nonomuraea soli]|uniref:Aminoglycoside phosphotransferase domain-containing protein n=1 Tax=Nonomuraea soli TaxID=1032476 RepID=A0A7W0CV89_9ACTN|nr:hypothetical protein [Nonomuraea soli]MBA2897973.1 hypothetical protein [Nonomuraea soli]